MTFNALGTLRRIGPIELNVGNHSATWTGDATRLGLRIFTLSGSLREQGDGRALLELVNNASRRVAYGEAVGVLEWIDGWGDYGELSGWALLTEASYTDGPANSDADAGWAPFSLTAVMVGGRDVVLARSVLLRPNTVGRAGLAKATQPLWARDGAFRPFLVDAGSSAIERYYDPRTPNDVRDLSNDGELLTIIRDPAETDGMVVQGDGGNAFTADHSSLDIVGDIDLRCAFVPFDWRPAQARSTILAKTDPDLAYGLELRGTASSIPGHLTLLWSEDGDNWKGHDSTVPVPNNPEVPLLVRATLDASFGSGTQRALVLDGQSGSNVDTPDHSSLDITGDLDIRFAVACDDWSSSLFQSFLDKVAIVSGTDQISYVLHWGNTRKLRFTWSTDGTGAGEQFAETDVFDPIDGEPFFCRVTIDVNNGSGGRTITFYSRVPNLESTMATLESNTGWTQAAQIVQAGVTSIHSGSSPVHIGGRPDGQSWLKGRVYGAVVKNGINGTTVAKPDFQQLTPGTTAFTDAAGRQWTLNGNAAIVGGSRRAAFYTKPFSRETVLADLESNSGWSQLGSLITSQGETSIFSGAGALRVGSRESSINPLAGTVYAAVVKNGIGGASVANPHFSGQDVGTTEFLDAAGRPWTLSDAAEIAGFTSALDTLPGILPVMFQPDGDPSPQVEYRGGDVVAIDRSGDVGGRIVPGPSHHFQRTTDLMLTNGLIRVWCGNRGLPPFLNLEAFLDGEWRAAGTIHLAAESSIDFNALEGARLVDVTPERAIAVLTVHDHGPYYVTLLRGERGVRVQSGDAVFPIVSGTRRVKFMGAPPANALTALTRVGSSRGSAYRMISSSRQSYFWPPDVDVDEWSLSVEWQSDLDYTTGGPHDDGAVCSIRRRDNTLLARVHYDPSAHRMRFTVGSQTLSSPVLGDGITLGKVVRVVASFSTTYGMRLTVWAPGLSGGGGDVYHDLYHDLYGGSEGTETDIYHAADASLTVSPATSSPIYALKIGPGSDFMANGGDYDQVLIVRDWMSEAEAETLVESEERLHGLPEPIGRCVWAQHCDVDPVFSGGSAADGRVSGAVDDWGATRVIVALIDATQEDIGLRGDFVEVFEAGAYLTIGEETASDLHDEFATEPQQELILQ